MRTPAFLSDRLRDFLRVRKIATLPELKQALGTAVDITVFRKLKELSYRSSYSHRGRYYTLDEIPQFDPQGLWSFHEVWFSRWGNLVTTLETLVSAAPQGYFANELQLILHVEVKDALLQLVQQRRVARQQVTGLFLYCSPDATVHRRQLLARQALSEIPGSASAEVSPEELKASLVLFSSLLDERQRRLYAGLESLKLGRGGDQRLAELLQLDPGTVARGRKQLLAQEVEWERVRKPGAGRKPVEKNAPSNLSNRKVVGTPHSRRSDEQPEVDAQNHGQDRRPITAAGHRGRRTHRRPIARQAPFLAPGELQKDCRRGPFVTRPTVPTDYPTATSLLPSWQSHHQRRCQEARIGG
jgi:hypothetical protein